ncbi:MAG: helix-turn-helix transcriptional regulator [Phycisphaerae bacterium]|nr:helix-turn-helix transcriptional regulator [Phycisphaerae bacterium]
MATADNPSAVAYSPVEIAGVRYAIIAEDVLLRLCESLAVAPAPLGTRTEPLGPTTWDHDRLATRIRARRRRADLTQAQLAERAGIRTETLNRIERGKTTPDFATIRKLVIAMDAAEAEVNAVSATIKE